MNKLLSLFFIIFILFILDKFISKCNLSKNKRIIKDALFISGYRTKSVSQHYRYRILHQIEQLNAGFLESNVYYYSKFDPLIVRDYRIIILFRCPMTKNVEKAIELAKSLNKKVIFDIDDLDFEEKYTDTLQYLKPFSGNKKEKYYENAIRMRDTLKLCDGAITTTYTIAKELNQYVSDVFINHNVASEEMWKLSEKALIKKYNNNNKKKDNIIIGYLSGSFSSYSDLTIIKPVLLKILKEFKKVQILLIGNINFPDYLNEFSSRVIFKEFMNWRKLPEIIANIDINIVPLENNILNSAKSEIKWLEASMVKVPTIASNLGIFKNVIKNNITGILCSDLNDWYLSLKTLINDKYLREILGVNAYNICKKEYNTLYTGYKFANYITINFIQITE